MNKDKIWFFVKFFFFFFYSLKVSWAISFIKVPLGPQGSLEVASRTLICTSLKPFAIFLLFDYFMSELSFILFFQTYLHATNNSFTRHYIKRRKKEIKGKRKKEIIKKVQFARGNYFFNLFPEVKYFFYLFLFL